MSLALIIGLAVLALIVLMAVKQRLGRPSQASRSGDAGGATYADAGSSSADCSTDGGGGGCD